MKTKFINPSIINPMFKYKIRISEPFDKDNVLEFEINSPHRLNEKLLFEEFKKTQLITAEGIQADSIKKFNDSVHRMD